MKIVVVIPTYNEAGNIGKLIDAISLEVTNVLPNQLEVLVVDDTSPDGTYKIVEKKQKEYDFLHLYLNKKKAGLGGAYTKGFNYAMSVMGADVVIEMDADFQHDSKDIPRFVKAIEEGADFVIGSRYIKGGSIPKEWAFYRKFLSIAGNLTAKFILGMFKVKEFTSGYRATRVKGVLDQIDFNTLLSSGFSYKLDLMYRYYNMGATIKEIPITFANREDGVSKMETNNPSESLLVVIKLRYERDKHFFKFLVVGGIGFVVDSVLFNVVFLIRALSAVAAIVSGFTAMLTTLILNNKWSFGDRNMGSAKTKALKTFMYFFSSTFPILFRNYIIEWGRASLDDTFIVRNLLFLFGVSVGLVWNFIVYNKIIWRK